MIGHLTGRLKTKHPPLLVVDVQGVGYELEAPMTTFYDLPAVGEQVTLHTHFLVREDAQLLYGFSRVSQRNLFRTLLRVNGVGPRVALAILSSLAANEFAECIQHADLGRLTKVPGVGRKTAERLVLELRDRLEVGPETEGATNRAGSEPDPVRDALSAMVSLGYKETEARRAVQAVRADGLSSEELIRQALRSISGSAA